MNFKTIAAALVICTSAGAAYAQQPATTAKPSKQIDSVWNGALIGAGAGVVGTWIFTRVNCGPRGYDNECSAIAELGGLALFVPSGAIAGAIIDRLINKTLPAGANAHTEITHTWSQQGGRWKTGVAFRLNLRFK